jgi:hypothetical protein
MLTFYLLRSILAGRPEPRLSARRLRLELLHLRRFVRISARLAKITLLTQVHLYTAAHASLASANAEWLVYYNSMILEGN